MCILTFYFTIKRLHEARFTKTVCRTESPESDVTLTAQCMTITLLHLLSLQLFFVNRFCRYKKIPGRRARGFVRCRHIFFSPEKFLRRILSASAVHEFFVYSIQKAMSSQDIVTEARKAIRAKKKKPIVESDDECDSVTFEITVKVKRNGKALSKQVLSDWCGQLLEAKS